MMHLPGMVQGPHQKDVLHYGCVCRARTSLEWHLHPQHFESVPRHDRRVINNSKDTHSTTGYIYAYISQIQTVKKLKSSHTEPSWFLS